MTTNSNKATVWSQPNCPYCDKAINLLTLHGYSIEVKKIGSNVTKEEFFACVPGARSVPQIFLQDEYIGTYNDLLKALN